MGTVALSHNPHAIGPSLQPYEAAQPARPSILILFARLGKDLLELQKLLKKLTNDGTDRKEIQYTKSSKDLSAKTERRGLIAAVSGVAVPVAQVAALALQKNGMISRSWLNGINNAAPGISAGSQLWTSKLEAEMSRLNNLIAELNTQMANNGQVDSSLKDQIMQTLQQMQDLMRQVLR